MDDTSPKPFVFVLMPFATEFNDIYEVGIKAAAREAGAYCERVDEQIFLESILERVYNQIAKADIIVAEMTGKNPNVFYEVGYAHALNKVVILLTRNSDDIPFDLNHYPHIVYGGSIAYLKSQLESRISWCIQNPKESRQINEFNLKLYLNGKLHHNEVRIETYEAGNKINARVNIDFHNDDIRVFQETANIGVIAPEGFDVDPSRDVQISIVSLPDKRKLYHIGIFKTILPHAWQSFRFYISRIYENSELEEKADMERNNFFMSYPIIIRVFTVFGPIDFPITLTITREAKKTGRRGLKLEE